MDQSALPLGSSAINTSVGFIEEIRQIELKCPYPKLQALGRGFLGPLRRELLLSSISHGPGTLGGEAAVEDKTEQILLSWNLHSVTLH